MATIKELMADKQPGTVKVAQGSRWYFVPFYQSAPDVWMGLKNGTDSQAMLEHCGWELYTEPKPKKILKEWLIRDKDSQRWWICDTLETEEAIRKFVIVHDYAEYRPTGREFEV